MATSSIIMRRVTKHKLSQTDSMNITIRPVEFTGLTCQSPDLNSVECLWDVGDSRHELELKNLQQFCDTVSKGCF